MSERVERLFADGPESVEPAVRVLDRSRFRRATRADWTDAELAEVELGLAAGRALAVPEQPVVPTGQAALSLLGFFLGAAALAISVTGGAAETGLAAGLWALIGVVLVVVASVVPVRHYQTTEKVRRSDPRQAVTTRLVAEGDREGQLLRRALAAIATVRDSAAGTAGIIERAAANLDLRAEQAAVARRVLAISETRREVESLPEAVRADAVWAHGLAAATNALEQRVDALEGYAGHVAELDEQLVRSSSLAQTERLSSKLLDLLAESGADRLAIEGLDGYAREADAHADAVRVALESVRTDHEAILRANLPD